MNPWEVLWLVVGWSLVAAVVLVVAVFAVAAVVAVSGALFRPRRKRGRATQIYSSGDK